MNALLLFLLFLSSAPVWGQSDPFFYYEWAVRPDELPRTTIAANAFDADAMACAVSATLRVHCWGDGPMVQRLDGVDAFALRKRVVAVTVGVNFGCAHFADLTAACWEPVEAAGSGLQYEVPQPQDPTRVSGEGHYLDLSAGLDFVVLSDLDVGLICLGLGCENLGNDLGVIQGDIDADGHRAIQVSAGRQHVCVLSTSATVYCTGVASSVPSTKFKYVASGDDFACGISDTDAVECWGAGEAAVLLPPSVAFDQIQCDRNLADTTQHFCCGLRSNNVITCWGVGAPVIPGDVRASSIAVTSSGGALGELCYVDADTSESKCLNSGLTAYERDYKSPTIAGGVACGVRGDEPFCWTDFGVRSLGVNSGSLPDVALVRVSQSGVMCLASSSNDVECVAKTIFNERVTSLSIGRDSTVCGVSDTGGTGGEIICSDPTVATNLNTVANSTVASFVKSAQVRALLAVLVSKPDEVSCVPDCASQADYSTFGFPVTFSNNVAQVAGATKFFCARLITGDIQCVNQAAPTGQFSYLACGFSTCCAISQDAKTVTCWGTLAVLNDAVPTLSGTWSELSISPSAVCGTFTPSFATASDIVCWGTVASLDRTQRTALGVSAAPRRDILISPGANPLVSNSACGIHVFPDCPNLPAAFSMYQGMAFADYTIAAGTYSSTTTVTLAGHFARVTAATRVFPAAAVLGGTGQILLASDYIGMEVSYVSFSGYDANGAMFISASTAQQGGAFVRLDHVHFEDIISRTASGSALQINAEITLVVSNSHFVNTQSASGDGGAVALFSGGSYWFQTCNFTNTKAFLSGGAIFASSSGAGVLRIRDSTFTGGEATRSQGGCVFINEPYMDVEVSDTTMRLCTAPADQAGAIAATSFQSFASSDLSILSCSADRVGAMYLNTFSTDVTVELSDLLVSGCSATDTAGILVTSVHTLRLNTARFLNNKVTRADGATQEQERGSSAGVQAETSALELIDCEFDGNSARSASSVHFNGDPNLAGGQTETPTFWFTATGCTVANNIADQNGAGFSLSGGDGYNLVGSISRCTFTNNTGEFASSVVATSVKSLNVTHSRFERNVAQAGGAMGLIFGHSARLDNVTFLGNRARYATEADRASLEADDIASGGALVLIPFFTSTPQDWVFTRCTFSDNSAEGSGGAVYWRTLNGQSLVNVFPLQSSSEITYSGNSALQGANVSSSETTATVDTVATQYSAKTGSAIRPVIVMRVFDAYGQAATALKQPCQARIENPLQDPLVAAIELDGTPSTSSAGVCTFSALTPRWDSRFFNSTAQMTVFIDDKFEGIDATVAATPISVRLEACDTGSIFVVEELTCLSCDPGKFANLTDPTEPRCELCDIGRFSSSSGARTCSPCGPGFVARSEGATECERCEAGSYSLPDRSECAECTPGRFQGSAGQTSCLACPRGSASEEDGATSCTPCPPGFAVFAEGATECNECGTGYFAKNPGSLNCTACPIGSAEDDEGASDCEVCAPGSFAAALASTECTECAAGTAQSNPGARNCEDCDYGTISDRTAQSECTACAAGKYTALTRQTECRACETSGLLCINGRSYVELNFWAYLDDDGDIRTTLCPEGICRSSTSRGAFIIDETGMLALESGESMNSLCGAGRLNYSENVLCGKCQEGFSEWNGECIECEEGGSGGIQFLFIVVAELFVIALIFVNRYRASGDVKIILYFVATARFLLGPEYYWLGWMGIFDFNPEAASAGDVCVMDLDPLEKMGFKLMMPLFFVFLLVVTCTLIWMCGGVCSCLRPRRDIAADSREDYGQDNARKADEGGFPTNVFIRSFLALLLFSYTSVSNIVLSFMHCVDVRGERVVFSVPAIDCDSDRYRRWSLLVYALFIFPVLGLPLITGYILRRAVRSGELVSTQRAMATKEKKFHARYSFLFESYRNGVYWWEVIALFRRSVLVAVRIALWDFPLERQQAIAITNLLLLMVHAMYQPFQFHHENSMETVSLAVLTTMSVIQTGIESFADYSDLQQVVLTLLTVVPFFGFGLYSLRTRCMAMCGKKVHRTVTAFGTDFARGAPEDEDAYSDSQDSESEVPGARRPQVEMQRVPVGNQPPAALPQQQRAQPAPIQQHYAPQQAQYAQSQPVHPAQVHPQQVQYAHSQPMGHQPSHSLSYSQPSASMMSESQSRQHMLSVSSQQQGEG